MSGESYGDSGDPRDTLVNVGNRHQVSMQVVQDIYSEITGKKEKLTKLLTKNHHATFEDINQLNTKIEQIYEQYNIVSSECSVTLYRVDDQKEQFSSFKRFSMHDCSSSNPVENIEITYNFLILLPQIQTPQSYKISLNLYSRAAIRQKANTQDGLPRKFFRFLTGPTGVVDIEYVDYTVARNFFTAINEWVDSLEAEDGSRVIRFAQSYSEHIPFMFRALTTLFLITFVAIGYSGLVGDGMALDELFIAGLVTFGGVYFMAEVSFKIGQLAEQHVDQYQPNSALRLTRGDEKIVTESARRNKASIRNGVISIATFFVLNLFAAWIAKLLGLVG